MKRTFSDKDCVNLVNWALGPDIEDHDKTFVKKCFSCKTKFRSLNDKLENCPFCKTINEMQKNKEINSKKKRN